MRIFDLFSKRQKRIRGEVPDVYRFDEIPQRLRVQIVHIVRDCIGSKKSFGDNLPASAYKTIFEILCREYGRFTLLEGNNRNNSEENQVLNFILSAEVTDEVLDVIELCFKYIQKVIDTDYDNYCITTDVKITPKDAIEELNTRFKENGIGFSFEDGDIIRFDSTYVHSEIVKPTLSLLHRSKFAGANEEYLKAHDHYRHGRNKECLTECLKAFESTMKTICKERGWAHDQTDSARRLIKICFQNGIVPSYTQNQFTSLQNLLESGVPTIRNKLGGHGQGQSLQKVDDEMTRYSLNLTGANIIFLIEQSGV